MRYILALISLAIAVSCGSDVDCDPNSFAADINAEVDKVNDVGAVFANDPSEDNCKAYLKAAEDYLKAVEQYENCVEVDQAQFSAQLRQAQELISILPCN